MWNDLIIFACVVGGVLGLVFLVDFFKQKGYFDEGDLGDSRKILDIVELIFNVINRDEKLKNKATFIFDLADIAVDYIAEIMDEQTDKKAVSLEVIEQLFDKFGVTPTEDEWKLIQIIVEEGLAFYARQKK